MGNESLEISTVVLHIGEGWVCKEKKQRINSEGWKLTNWPLSSGVWNQIK